LRGDQPGGPIRWRMHLSVPPERVFNALNSDDGRASFWATSAVETDGSIEFQFSNGCTCRCLLTARVYPSLFVIEYIEGTARFELSSDGHGGTDLFLVQTGVGMSDWNEVHAGWLNVLFPLKAMLVHGIDLRNHDPNRSWDNGYADQ
jgi:uncharacterized protein YndB with AHSA1/START domain